jgi:hypothetical protein
MTKKILTGPEALAQNIAIALKAFKPPPRHEPEVTEQMKRQRRLYAEMKAAIEAVIEPDTARIAALETKVARLETRLAKELERRSR